MQDKVVKYSELKIGECFRWNGKVYARAGMMYCLDNFDFQLMKNQHLNIDDEDTVERVSVEWSVHPNH